MGDAAMRQREMTSSFWVTVVAFCAALLVSLVGALAAAPASRGGDEAVHYYLSLGDSLAAGEQPTLPPGQNFGDEGYADQLYALERNKIANLTMVKLGCGGESTASMITAVPTVLVPGIGPVPYEGRGDHFFCSFPHGSQLAEAVSFLHAHRGFVSFVSIDIGPNDLFQLGPVDGRAQIMQNLPVILAALRDAAGPGVPIIGMNFYDPFLVVWFSDPAALGPEVASSVEFNNMLERIYAAAGDPVADVESAFSTTVTTPVGGIPLDVLRICQWTWMCAPSPLGPNIHANTTGYGVIAQAFENVLGP
jgi:lysophospholipase L1-like esterase